MNIDNIILTNDLKEFTKIPNDETIVTYKSTQNIFGVKFFCQLLDDNLGPNIKSHIINCVQDKLSKLSIEELDKFLPYLTHRQNCKCISLDNLFFLHAKYQSNLRKYFYLDDFSTYMRIKRSSYEQSQQLIKDMFWDIEIDESILYGDFDFIKEDIGKGILCVNFENTMTTEHILRKASPYTLELFISSVHLYEKASEFTQRIIMNWLVEEKYLQQDKVTDEYKYSYFIDELGERSPLALFILFSTLYRRGKPIGEYEKFDYDICEYVPVYISHPMYKIFDAKKLANFLSDDNFKLEDAEKIIKYLITN